MELKKFFFLILYYGLFRNLPDIYDHPAFTIFNNLRSWSARGLFKKCGSHVNVHQGARFGLGNEIFVGENSNLGVNVYINGRGGVKIGCNVLMGPDVIIYTGTHTFDDLETPIHLQPMIYKPVFIEDDVWIGARTVIMPGITIGKGSVIGANSTVTKDIPPYVVAVGSPARIIRERRQKSRESSDQAKT